MGDKSYGRIFSENLVAAIPWALVFSVVLLILGGLFLDVIRQEAKEAIEYTSDYGIRNALRATLDDRTVTREIVPKVKQAVKETIEFAVITDRAYPHRGAEGKPGGRK